MTAFPMPVCTLQPLNLAYAATLRHVGEVIASAPVLPLRVEFTSIIRGLASEESLGRVLLIWAVGRSRLRLEFDADGLVDYWLEPDPGPIAIGEGENVLDSLFAWLLQTDRELDRTA
jgi:hypothetical protein